MPEPDEAVDVGAALRRFGALLGASALVFAAGVTVSELGGELAHDVDFKPFFLVYLLVALVGFGGSTLAIGLGAAIGEGFHDLAEGYEPDEPLGFLGYLAGFMAFAWVLHRVAPDPGNRRYQVGAAVAGAFVQALFEGFAFLFERDFTPNEAILSVAGNTVTHGLLLGAVPLVALYPLLATRWEGDSGAETGEN